MIAAAEPMPFEELAALELREERHRADRAAEARRKSAKIDGNAVVERVTADAPQRAQESELECAVGAHLALDAVRRREESHEDAASALRVGAKCANLNEEAQRGLHLAVTHLPWKRGRDRARLE